MRKNKLLIICGPTATGKTALGIYLAKKIDGELISADSRQVYKYMDIGTGKDILNSEFRIQNSKLQLKIQKEINLKITLGVYEIDKIPIWGLDLVKPDQEFSVAHWVRFANLIIKDIWKRKKLPIIVGGTGFWLKALIDGIDSINIPPDWQLREKLRNLEIEKLREILKKLDPERWQSMNQSDRKNPRRLIRGIEIAEQIKSLKLKIKSYSLKLKIDQLLIIGLIASNKFLYQRIDQRVEKRIKQGAQKEIETLLKKGYPWDLEAMTATGYKEWQPFFQKKVGLEEIIQRWKYNEHAYARRQLTWFKKDKRIKWFNIEKPDWQNNVVKLVENWYH